MHLRKLFRDRESQPCTAKLAGDGRIDLPELRKYIFELVFWNTDSGVGHLVDELVPGELHCDVDVALPGKLDCVACEIHQALCEPAAVAVSDRQVIGNMRAE